MGSAQGSGLLPASSPGYMVGDAEIHRPKPPPPTSPFAGLEQQNSDPTTDSHSLPSVLPSTPPREKLGNHVRSHV